MHAGALPMDHPHTMHTADGGMLQCKDAWSLSLQLLYSLPREHELNLPESAY